MTVLLSRHLPSDHSVGLNDVTSKYTVINLVGPKATGLLSELSNSDINLSPFSYKVITACSLLELIHRRQKNVRPILCLTECKCSVCF